jgi:hypothetical protein
MNESRNHTDVAREMDRIAARLRDLSKECLVLTSACEIWARATSIYPNDDVLRQSVIEEQIKVFEEWKPAARQRNRLKRLGALLDRLKNPRSNRRRRRRRIQTITVKL